MRFSTQTSRAPGSASRARATSRDEYRPDPGGSGRRSTTSMTGHPLRSSVRDGTMSGPFARASSDGQGDVSTHGTPARRARSTATSRAFHVGARSSWYASSPSSTTSTAPSCGRGAQAPARAPTATQPPAAARAHSWGTRATRCPSPRSRAARKAAAESDGARTRASPCAAAAMATGSTSPAGGIRMTVTPGARVPARSARPGSGSARTARGGDAVPSSCAGRPAHRHAAHRAREITSAGGPQPVTLARGCSGRSVAASPGRPTTHPPMRRPWSGTRTIVPTRTSPARWSGIE